MRIWRVAVGIPVGTPHRPHRTEQGALHHSAPSSSLPQRYGTEIVPIPSTPGALFPFWRAKLACNPSGSNNNPIKALNRIPGSARARCVKRISPVVMVKVRSVSGHVSPTRYSKPTPLCSVRITRLRRSYGCPRLPTATSLFLAFYTCPRVRTPCAPTVGSPWLPHSLNVRLDATSDPGVTPAARH